MRDHVDTSRVDVIEALKTTFADRFGAEPGDLSTDAVDEARRRAADRFGTDAWNHQL